jgi:hypothetical protein
MRARRLPEIAKVEAEVQARLKREILHWDNRAEDLRAQERAGKPAGRLNASQAGARAQDLADRLERRLAELNRERDLSALPPVVRGGSLVVTGGLLRQLWAAAATGTGVRRADRRDARGDRTRRPGGGDRGRTRPWLRSA